MKQIKAIALLSLAAGFLLAACSSEDEPKQEIDAQTVKGYQSGELSRCFKIKNYETYVREDGNSSKWKEPDKDYCRDFFPISRIYFTEGKVWIMLELDPVKNSYAKWQTMMALNAYKKVSQKKPVIYVATTFRVDPESNVMRIKDSYFKVIKMTNASLVLDDYVEEVYPEDRIRDILYYESEIIPQEELDRSVSFESERAALLYIIKIAREQFGNIIDLNKIYSSEILDEPIINLDELEEKIYAEYGD